MKPLSAAGSSTRAAVRVAAAVLVSVMLAGKATAQEPPAPLSPAVTPLASTVAPLIPTVAETREGAPNAVIQASCSSCGALPPGTNVAPFEGPGVFGYGKRGAPPGCAACSIGCGDAGCGEAGCVAGRQPCETCETDCRLGRIFCAFHNAICCPDPCYEPTWVPAANAAFFVPAARPGTYTRFRYDYGNDVTQPDRSEYFWAAIGGKGPGKPESRVNYNEISMYAEVGTPKFSFFVDTPYINLHGDANGGAGSFGDLSLGTKSVLLDSEMLLTTFQFKTTIPTGVPGKGTGVGHVSLEPSLLWSMKIHPDMYWQSQLAYWIPISATPGFAGGVLEYNNSLNMVLCRPLRDTALIGTIETSGWTFTAGSFTDPTTGAKLRGNQATYFNIGPGLRLAVCDNFDVGFGVQFAATSDHFAQQLYRTEFRWRF